MSTGGPLLAIFARGGCKQYCIFGGHRLAERKRGRKWHLSRPWFFEGCNSTVVSRVGPYQFAAIRLSSSYLRNGM